MRPLTEAENKITEFKTELDIEYTIQLEAVKNQANSNSNQPFKKYEAGCTPCKCRI